MGKILVAGSINMDVIAQTQHHPQLGETVFGCDLHYIPGGKGSNQAVAAARLRGNVYLAGKLGKDAFGQSLTEFLQGESLNLDYLCYSDTHPSGVALITIDENSENTIVVISGSNFQVTEQDVSHIPLESDDTVVGVFEIPQASIKHLFSRAKQAGARTILNPAPAHSFIDGLLPLVDYLIINETELAFFSRQAQVSDNPDVIRNHALQFRSHPEQHLIVTLGARGLLCVHHDSMILLDGIPVDAVDTTGAGDCFTGALSVAISENMPIHDALLFANTAASISVQSIGASSSMPHRDAIDEFSARE